MSEKARQILYALTLAALMVALGFGITRHG